ncbi:tetratricopeptide repeat protein [Nonomuraea sp. NPDC046570]|uniref:ATP-binding protein n=1 Tax=Nonomuraea sp. NPDC046570 TaxID=3155255 RepID=UPI0033E7FC96
METSPGWRRNGNLPVELASFVGRDDQLLRLTEMLATSRVVTVVGSGGVGKTRIAVKAATRARDRFPDGVWMVDLSQVRDPELLPHALSAAMGLRDRSRRTEMEFLLEYLRDKKLLLLLDTCEHLVEACGALVEELMAGPGLQILATSRQPLGLDFEQRMPLPPLDEGDAVELFLDRARQVLPGSVPDRQVVSEIVQHLDRIPLAIELAAGRLPALSAEQILSLLSDRFRLLRREAGSTVPNRHHALRTAMGWSHELCEPVERLLWARLTVFAGAFDLAAAKYICASDELPEASVVETLRGLVDKSILTRLPGSERYRMLDTIRAYGRERLKDLDETSWLTARYRDYYLDLAKRAERSWSQGSRQVYWYDQMMREHSHLRAVMEHCLSDQAGIELGLDLAASLWFLWHGCGLTGEGGHFLDRALKASRRPSRERCRALWVRSFVASAQGDIDVAELSAKRCLDEAALIGDSDAMVYATKMTGLCAYLRGDMPRAIAYLGSAVKSFRAERGLNPGLLPAIVELAVCLAAQGEPEDAEQLLLECLQMCEENGEQWLRSYAYWALAETNRELGRFTKAVDAAQQAMRIKRDFHDVIGTLLCSELLAWLHTDNPSPESAKEAAILLGATSAAWKRFGLQRCFGSPVFIAHSDTAMARAKALLGEQVYLEIAEKGAAYELDDVVERALA